MPRQLKVLVLGSASDPSANRVIDAPFTVNFAAPIIIEPGNKLTLDKFSCVVNNLTSGFNLPESIFTLYYSLLSANYIEADITIPGATYASITDLMAAMTLACNNVVSGFVADYVPNSPPIRYYRDRGLKIGCGTTAAGNSFEMDYVTAPWTTLDLSPFNMSLDASGNYSPTEGGLNWFLANTTAGQYLLKGGGLLCEFQVIIPPENQIVADQSFWKLGFIGSDDSSFGIGQNYEGEPFFMYNGDAKTPLDPEVFYNQNNCFAQFYQSNGLFGLRVFLRDLDNGIEATIYNSAISNPGALGTVNYSVNYEFVASGYINADPLTYNVPKIHNVVKMTTDVVFGSTNAGYPRTVGFDMTKAGSLRAGLAVPAGLLVLAPQVSDFGTYTPNDPINMSAINSTFDLAVEVLDLPLQTYQATSNRDQGSRQNIIAYFTPYLSNVGTNTYTYAASCYQWLDIDISYPLNISSLSFRVFDPNTGVDLAADSMSFNLMINTTEY